MGNVSASNARIVVAGGGVAALEAVIALRALAGDAPAITMIAPNDDFVYQPLSVGEPFALGPAPRLPLRTFAEDLGVHLVRDGVDFVGKDRAVILKEGGFVAYDKLVMAVGAPRVPVYANATTFRGENDVEAVRGLVQDVEMGYIKRIAFVVPAGVAWSLPLYELALMTAQRAWEMQVDVELTLITPEDRPLSVFGAKGAGDVEQRLADAGVRLIPRAVAEIPARGRIAIHPGGEELECDRVIALPISEGPAIEGLPSDGNGFIPIDSFARVSGMPGVYAAGDGTNFPLKQGGIACQQADAAAAHIAASLGAGNEPEPFRPVLRGQLLTGTKPQFLRRDVAARREGREQSSIVPLWWPATKVAGKYLAAYISEHDASQSSSREIAPGVKRRAFLAAALDDTHEVPLRGYEYAGRWGSPLTSEE